MPAGHFGSRFGPERIGAGPWPSLARASRAQRRAVTNSRRRSVAVGSCREHLLRHWRLASLAPFARISKRDLLKADAVVVGRAWDVQMTVDDDFSPIPDVPIRRPRCAAPLREF